MASGPLSPLMITANAGLLDNTALAVPQSLYNAISGYLAAIGGISPPPTPGVDPDVLTNTIPASYTAAFSASGLPTSSLTDAITAQAERLLPVTDLSKFCQLYSMCQAYRITTNQTINSTKNSDVIDTTFTNMDNLSTGGITQLTSDPPVFGSDLSALGQLIDLKLLDQLGYPSTLLYQILNQGGLLPGLYDILVLNDIDDTVITQLKQSSVSPGPAINLRLYRAFSMVTGDTLTQIKKILGVTTPGISTLADLLNPKKILPNGYATLAVEPPVGYSFTASENYQLLSKIIPADQALDNVTLIYGFQQIKNVRNVDFPALAAAISAQEKPGNFNSTTAIPESAKTQINSSLATGSGPDGTLTLYDFMGTAIGYISVESLNSITNGILDNSYLTNIAPLEDLWTAICDQISLEITNLDNAQVDFSSLTSNSKISIMSVAMGLHDIGLDVEENGPNDFFTAAATSTTGGQAITGSLKEGRNLQALGAAGIGSDTQLNAG